MYEHQGRIHAVMLGVGAGFDFHAGTVKRAPDWMRRHYLEWMYRLVQDPKRLWKRYVQTNGQFVLLSIKDAFIWKKYRDENKKNLLIYAHYYYPDVASTGQILTVLSEENGWAKVRTQDNQEGYVSAEYLIDKVTGTVVNINSALNVRETASSTE